MQSNFDTKASVPTNLILPTTASDSKQSKIEERYSNAKVILAWTSIFTFTPIQATQTERMSRNFPRPFTTRNTQGTSISAQASPPSDMSSSLSRSSSLDVPNLVRGRRLTIADSKASVPTGNSTAMPTLAPQLGHLDFEFSSRQKAASQISYWVWSSAIHTLSTSTMPTATALSSRPHRLSRKAASTAMRLITRTRQHLYAVS
jgi:hypothetical protein